MGDAPRAVDAAPLIEEMERKHINVDGYCPGCNPEYGNVHWPCDVVRILAALRAAREPADRAFEDAVIEAACEQVRLHYAVDRTGLFDAEERLRSAVSAYIAAKDDVHA